MAVFKITVKRAASHISSELLFVYTIRRAPWCVAGKKWKIDIVKV